MRTAMNVGVCLVLLAAAAAFWGPRFFEPKVQWNDTAAFASLLNLASVQGEFRNRNAVDVDGDRVGEYGTFAELTGSAGLRLDGEGESRGAPLSPPTLSPIYAVGAGGLACKSGYFFRIVLPAGGGGPTGEGAPGEPITPPVHTDSAERMWCAYAWPTARWGSSHSRAKDHSKVLFVDWTGRIWFLWNRDHRYVGPEGGPAWDAAMPADLGEGTWAAPFMDVEEYRGRDGNTWRRLRSGY